MELTVFFYNIDTMLPGQGFVLHSTASKQLPSQKFPPYLGDGFVHDRVRNFDPVPQDLEHRLKLPYTVHCPSTIYTDKVRVNSALAITMILLMLSIIYNIYLSSYRGTLHPCRVVFPRQTLCNRFHHGLLRLR